MGTTSRFFSVVRLSKWATASALPLLLTATALAATFGTVVEIGGHVSDIALDERRGLVYLANYTANRIEQVSTSDLSRRSPINVPPQPAALALSGDGRFLVIAHYRDGWDGNGISILDLDGNTQRFLRSGAPLAVAFGSDGLALVATTSNLLLVEPSSGTVTTLTSFSAVATALPVPFATFPPAIMKASMTFTPDRKAIHVLADLGPGVIYAVYDAVTHNVQASAFVATPQVGPRIVSVSNDGSYAALGWVLLDRSGTLVAQFPSASGKLELGSHTIDSNKKIIYAQIPGPKVDLPNILTGAAPVLSIHDLDNLTVREWIQLPENLAGKSLLTPDGATIYAISDSGMLVLPVGSINRYRRLSAVQEDVMFRGAFCDRSPQTKEIDIVDPGGGNTAFSLAVRGSGVTVSPSSGTTPAKVKVTVDFNAFQNVTGTTTGYIDVKSSAAINMPASVRVLVSNREPDQRGAIFNVPGKLVDLVADPARDRFYILRQDKNQVLVFKGSTFEQVATLRTGNTPWQMAITMDQKYLLVGNDNSQIANVYDLDTLEQQAYIRFPYGHYPRSIAVTGSGIYATARTAGVSVPSPGVPSPGHKIDYVDMGTRQGVALSALGIYQNIISQDAMLAVSPTGASMIMAQPDGTVLLYDASAATFTASRRDLPGLSGTIGAPSDDRFVVDTYILDNALVPMNTLDKAMGSTSGIAAAVGNFTIRTAATAASSPGFIERFDLKNPLTYRQTRMAEAPLLPAQADRIFIRSLTPLASRNAIVSLTTSGFTALAWEFDAAVALARIDGVSNAGDGGAAVAPGSLIRVTGSNLSPGNAATSELPAAVQAASSCLTVNGIFVPIVGMSATQITAQLPFSVVGPATMVLKNVGGVSNSFAMQIQPAAPAVFRTVSTGSETDLAAIVRYGNGSLVTLSNPIRGEDTIVIYLTGMGQVTPEVPAGEPGPGDPVPQPIIAPDVNLGGVGLTVEFAGYTPGQIGVYQINAKVPWWISSGLEVPLEIKQGAGSTTLIVRVVK